MPTILPSGSPELPPEPQPDPTRRLLIFAEASKRLLLRAFAATTVQAPAADIEYGSTAELTQRIAHGAPADLLLGTNLALIRSVAPAGTLPTEFARDTLVVAARRELSLTTHHLLERLLGPRLRLGIAGPVQSHGTSPAEQFFDLAEAAHPGAGAILRAKALPMLTWGHGPTPRRIMEQLGTGEVDAVLGTASALRTLSSVVDLVAPPAELAVTITSYVVVLATTPSRRASAEAYVAALRGPHGQTMLSRHGFTAHPPEAS
jgi:molybdate transport system substrate-binding protein